MTCPLCLLPASQWAPAWDGLTRAIGPDVTICPVCHTRAVALRFQGLRSGMFAPVERKDGGQ